MTVPELEPTSRGYDVDAHAMLAITAAQCLLDAHGAAELLVHNLDCALRAQLLLRETVFADRIVVRCAAWRGDGAASDRAPGATPLVVVGPDDDSEAAEMRSMRTDALRSGTPVVLFNHRPLGVGGRLRKRLGVELSWSPQRDEELAFEVRR